MSDPQNVRIRVRRAGAEEAASRSSNTNLQNHNISRMEPPSRMIMQRSTPSIVNRKKVNEEEEETVFETTRNPRPAVAGKRTYKLKWKRREDAEDRPQVPTAKASDTRLFPDRGKKTEENCSAAKLIADANEKRIAKDLMVQIRQANILESVLSREQNIRMKSAFESGWQKYGPEDPQLLQAAMDRCWNEVMYRQVQHDIVVDNPTRLFLCDKAKAKTRLLEILLSMPEFVPMCWGGKSMEMYAMCRPGAPSALAVPTPADGSGAQKDASPWTKMMLTVFYNEKTGDRLVVAEAPKREPIPKLLPDKSDSGREELKPPEPPRPEPKPEPVVAPPKVVEVVKETMTEKTTVDTRTEEAKSTPDLPTTTVRMDPVEVTQQRKVRKPHHHHHHHSLRSQRSTKSKKAKKPRGAANDNNVSISTHRSHAARKRHKERERKEKEQREREQKEKEAAQEQRSGLGFAWSVAGGVLPTIRKSASLLTDLLSTAADDSSSSSSSDDDGSIKTGRELSPRKAEEIEKMKEEDRLRKYHEKYTPKVDARNRRYKPITPPKNLPKANQTPARPEPDRLPRVGVSKAPTPPKSSTPERSSAVVSSANKSIVNRSKFGKRKSALRSNAKPGQVTPPTDKTLEEEATKSVASRQRHNRTQQSRVTTSSRK